jgi:hypothetical protein
MVGKGFTVIVKETSAEQVPLLSYAYIVAGVLALV